LFFSPNLIKVKEDEMGEAFNTPGRNAYKSFVGTPESKRQF
jgi:hypothetical protein